MIVQGNSNRRVTYSKQVEPKNHVVEGHKMILNEITKLANFSLKFEFKKQKTTTKQQVEFDPDGVDEDG